MSWNLWIKEREFPLVPAFEVLDKVPALVHLILLISSLGMMAAIIYRPGVKWLLLTALILELASCMLDQNRWQPWEYQYLFMLLVFIINKEKAFILNSICIILACGYFYSGLNKLNEGFVSAVWENLVWIRFLKFSPETVHASSLVYYSGFLAGFLELTAGAGLFFKKTQKAAAVFLIITHGFILLLFGPAGLNYNTIILPWNFLMILLLIQLFLLRSENISFRLAWYGMNKAVLVFWMLMPAAGIAGLWDRYLSLRLYSGNMPMLTACIPSEGAVPQVLKPYVSIAGSYDGCNAYSLNINRWALAEIKVPVYPEMRVYKVIRKKWESAYPRTGATFKVYNNYYKATNLP